MDRWSWRTDEIELKDQGLLVQAMMMNDFLSCGLLIARGRKASGTSLDSQELFELTT
jgi:hypothetical protein